MYLMFIPYKFKIIYEVIQYLWDTQKQNTSIK